MPFRFGSGRAIVQFRKVTRWVRACTAVIVLGASLMCESSAYASGGGDGCNPGRSASSGFWWDGLWEGSAGTIGGAVANIQVYSPYVHSSFTSGWTMLVNTSAGNYAQIGWRENSNGNRYLWDQFGYNSGDSGYYDNLYPPDPINTQHNYKVDWAQSTDTITLIEDGNNINVDFDLGLGTINQSQFYGETHDQASQVPGASNNKMTMNQLKVRHPAGSTGTWHTGAANVSTPPSFANISPVSGPTPSALIWDTGCTD
jgi:hypothetical protein